jgi:hypothetical protein
LSTTPQVRLPDVALPADRIQDPMLFLPLGTILDNVALLKSTDTFPRMPNGANTIVPAMHEKIRANVHSFPDADSVAYLRGLGIRTVVVMVGEPDLEGWVYDTDKPIDELGITRTDLDGEVIYHLS